MHILQLLNIKQKERLLEEKKETKVPIQAQVLVNTILPQGFSHKVTSLNYQLWLHPTLRIR